MLRNDCRVSDARSCYDVTIETTYRTSYSPMRNSTPWQCLSTRLWLPKNFSRSDKIVFPSQPDTRLTIWAGFLADGRARTPLVFLPDNSKLDVNNYREMMLEGCMIPWAKKYFKNRPYTVQHDSTLVHKSKEIQTWLSNKTPGFISIKEWPTNLSGLNPLKSYSWKILEKRVCAKKYDSVAEVKAAFVREWEKVPQNVLRQAANSFTLSLEKIAYEKHWKIKISVSLKCIKRQYWNWVFFVLLDLRIFEKLQVVTCIIV